MRWIGWIAALVLGVGWLLSGLPPSGEPRDRDATIWRRTADGWERADRWFPKHASGHQPAVHPLVAGGFGLLAATLGLLSLSPTPRRNGDES